MPETRNFDELSFIGMAAEPEIYRKEAETEFTYRCPGCDEMVDRRNLDAVLAHHQHVLRPRNQPPWFEREMLVKGSGAARMWRSDPSGSATSPSSAQADGRRLRRYGHG